MATPTPATVQEFRDYLDNTDADVAELEAMLESATEAAEGWHAVGPIVARSFTDRITAECGRLILPRTPVQSVTSATRISDGREYVTADLDVDGHPGIVRGVGSRLQDGAYTVVYIAGRSPVPESLALAVLIIAGHLWQTQQGPTGNRWPRADNGDSGHRVSAGYLIPNRAAHLLQPHANVPVG